MSEAPEPPVTDPVTAAIQGLRSAVERLGVVSAPGADGELWTMAGPDLLEATVELHRLMCAADAVLHGMVREIDSRGAATGDRRADYPGLAAGAAAPAPWRREAADDYRPGAARRPVRRAGAPRRARRCARAGRPGGAGGRVRGRGDLRRARRDGLPGPGRAARPVEPTWWRRPRPTCAPRPPAGTPKVLARLARHLAHVLDPEAGDTLADTEDHDRASQELHVRQRADGGSDVRGHFGAELTAELLSQLQPLAGPRPELRRPPRPPHRGPAQRRRPRRAAAAGPRSPAPPRPGTVPGPPSPSRWRCRPCERRLGAPARPWTGPAPSRPRPPAGSPATPRSSRWCSAAAASRSTSAAPPTRSPPRSGGPWSPATAAVPSTAAIGPPEWTEAHHRDPLGRRRRDLGRPTAACSATTTTAESTTTAGTSS